MYRCKLSRVELAKAKEHEKKGGVAMLINLVILFGILKGQAKEEWSSKRQKPGRGRGVQRNPKGQKELSRYSAHFPDNVAYRLVIECSGRRGRESGEG